MSSVRHIPVIVVLPPRTLLLDVAGPIEVVRKANLDQAAVAFDVTYVGPRASLPTSIGLEIGGIAPLPDRLPDGAIVVLVGSADVIMNVDSTDVSMPALDERSLADHTDDGLIVTWLRDTIRDGHRLVSICSGALLAGRAGLLDGYDCTTHHACCADLARLAPRARVIENRLFVEDRDRLSSAGITAGIDLMLHLVAQLIGPACALAVARYLVVYLRRGGGDPQLSPWLEGRNHLHPVVHRAQDAIAGDPARAWTLADLAAIAYASPRHLSRLFNDHAGMSLTDYINRLRVSLARELLGQTRLDLEHVAERSGFASARQLRRAWSRFNATPPSQARRSAG
ncbi:GlxA family transcriptional regulator [Lichenihabitans psoromatis]|uniref:GlxA family transcriptional regulator n=1 Tax=Lichenihabitans psoromatis TaxID=2528642 RepID=UPI0010384A56|nr:helix-turn-helix domain-containing protein [Lichenihabitans psoromatis]